MFCEKCHARTATVHMQQTVNGAYSERHLCEECARKDGVAVFDAFTRSPVDFFFDQPLRPIRQMVSQFAMSTKGGMDEAVCDISPEREAQYVAFREKISPFFALKGQKDNKSKTKGKEKIMKEDTMSDEMKALQKKLHGLIIDEHYEEAAKVRDEIKQLKEKGKEEGGNENGK